MTNTLLVQAAAEYVGVAMTGALRSVGSGLRSFGSYWEDNPAMLAGAVILLLVIVRLLGRRR
ncbi:MAG: hypothetical protein ACC682_05565 [Gemmatimonadota bacterium]